MERRGEREEEEEISFSSKSYGYTCVCFVSLIDSIGTTYEINDPDKVRRYYSIFINTMTAIARNFDAKVIKNTGTSLIYGYFPKTFDSSNLSAFKDVIECGLTMMVANKVINLKLEEEELPSLQYKISADYVRLPTCHDDDEVARSRSSPDSDDLFGSTMNICAKITSMASPNGMVIGSDLYYVAKKFFSYFFEGHGHHYYNFKRIGDYSIAASIKYPVYSVVAVRGGGEEQIVNILDLEKQFPKLQNPSPPFPFPAETTHKVNKGLEPPYLNYEGYQPENQKLERKGTEIEERQTQQQKKTFLPDATIMLVDDDPDTLLTYKTFLTIGGYNVDAFTDPREALTHFVLADPNNYNLVVMDIRMPNLSGLQLYRLKAINPNIKILFVSALDTVQEMVNTLPAVKLVDIIRKPVDQFLYKVKTALEPTEKELEELKNRHQEIMSFFSDIDKEDDNAIIEKFEPANVRDDFEYAFKIFSKALDVILPRKEADPYIPDFKYISKIRQMIRTYYEGVGHSLRVDGKKVQQLIDDHIRSLDIAELMNPKEVTYDNFLGYAAKFKSERARTALIKNKARQIIKELAPTNPAYYEKLRERLEKIIEQEEKRRKEDASYFATTAITQVYNEALDTDKQRKKLGFSTPFEFVVYEELQSITNDKNTSKITTESIFGKVKEETKIVGWKSKTSSEKKLSTAIYDILTENKYPEDKVDKITTKIIELAKRNLP